MEESKKGQQQKITVEIQKWVVKMKDELEKIKEQSLNIL